MIKSVRVLVVFFLSIFATNATAESIPGGWVLSDDGILSKGTSYVRMFDQVELNGLSVPEYVESIKESKPKPDDLVVSVGSVENGKYVMQTIRVIERDGVQAHSVLMVCNFGQFKHHLLEIFVERKKVLDIIAAGKYAIGVCAS